MRVGIVCPYSLTLPGGVQEQVLALGRALRRRGIDARVLGPCDGAPPDPAVTPLGNSLPTAANGSVAPVAPDVSAQLRTIRALRDEAFDVLHLHEPLAPGPTHTTLVMHPAPILATFHAAGTSAPYRYLNPGVRLLAARIDKATAVSDMAVALARTVYDGDIEVTFNGVDVDSFRGLEPWPTSGPTVLFIGRHEPRKGLAVLIEAIAQLPDEVTCWVAGDGPESSALRLATSRHRRFEWLGRISDHEKRRRLVGADVFCAPSLGGESFGIVLLEAMAAHTPVVASSIAGYANVARAGRDALMVSPNDADALADALRRALFEPAERARLVSSGAERAEEFAMRRLAGIYAESYERLLDRAEPRTLGRRSRLFGSNEEEFT